MSHIHSLNQSVTKRNGVTMVDFIEFAFILELGSHCWNRFGVLLVRKMGGMAVGWLMHSVSRSTHKPISLIQICLMKFRPLMQMSAKYLIPLRFYELIIFPESPLSKFQGSALPHTQNPSFCFSDMNGTAIHSVPNRNTGL